MWGLARRKARRRNGMDGPRCRERQPPPVLALALPQPHVSPVCYDPRHVTGDPVMSWSVNIGSIAGTAIRIHVTFILFLAFLFFVGLASGNVLDGLKIVAFIVLLFACVLAH